MHNPMSFCVTIKRGALLYKWESAVVGSIPMSVSKQVTIINVGGCDEEATQ